MLFQDTELARIVRQIQAFHIASLVGAECAKTPGPDRTRCFRSAFACRTTNTSENSTAAADKTYQFVQQYRWPDEPEVPIEKSKTAAWLAAAPRVLLDQV